MFFLATMEQVLVRRYDLPGGMTRIDRETNGQ